MNCTLAATPTLSYDPEIGPGYFIQIRSDFVRFPGFSPPAKVLYMILCTYAAEGCTAFPGQVRLAEHCGICVRQVRRVIDEVEAAGLITVTQRGQNLPNLYHVHKLPVLAAGPRPPAAPAPTKDRTQSPARSGLRVRRVTDS